jgi:gas vesicle protein
MSDDRGSLGTGILLFLLGAAAGAVVVALVTPKSGPELRADVKGLARRLRHKVKASRRVLVHEGEADSGAVDG